MKEKWIRFDRFWREIECGCTEHRRFCLAGDKVDKILALLKSNRLDPEAVAEEMRTLIDDDFVFEEGFRHQVDDDRWTNWKRVPFEMLLVSCYKLWPE
jgi:hypothetical protein